MAGIVHIGFSLSLKQLHSVMVTLQHFRTAGWGFGSQVGHASTNGGSSAGHLV